MSHRHIASLLQDRICKIVIFSQQPDIWYVWNGQTITQIYGVLEIINIHVRICVLWPWTLTEAPSIRKLWQNFTISHLYLGYWKMCKLQQNFRLFNPHKGFTSQLLIKQDKNSSRSIRRECWTWRSLIHPQLYFSQLEACPKSVSGL